MEFFLKNTICHEKKEVIAGSQRGSGADRCMMQVVHDDGTEEELPVANRTVRFQKYILPGY